MVWMWTVPHQFMSCLEMLRNPWDTGSSGCMRPTGWGSWGLQSSQSPTHTSLAVWSCSIPSCLRVFTYMDKANPASTSYHPWWTASLNRESKSILPPLSCFVGDLVTVMRQVIPYFIKMCCSYLGLTQKKRVWVQELMQEGWLSNCQLGSRMKNQEIPGQGCFHESTARERSCMI